MKSNIFRLFCVFRFFIIISSVRHILLHHSRQKITINRKSFSQLIAIDLSKSINCILLITVE